MKCDICNEEFEHSKQYVYDVSKLCSNLCICPSCFEHYLNTRTIHNFVCKTCGVEFEMTYKMSKIRDLSNLTANECIKCARITGRIKYKQTCLEQYGVENPRQLDKIKEKYKSTCLQRYGVENPTQAKLIRTKTASTCLKRYGVEHPLQSNTIKDKVKSTMLSKYGVEHSSKNKTVKEKSEQTCLARYGVKHVLESDTLRNKIANINLQKYGVSNPAQIPEIQERIKETSLSRYGVSAFAKTTKSKLKTKETNIRRYGVENPMQTVETKEKLEQTCFEHYGVRNAFQSPDVKDKIKQIMLQRYGVEHSMQSPEIRSKAAKSARVSKLEKRVIEMLTNRGIEFQHQYTIRQNEVTHSFDFAIFKDSVLIALVDTDGVYFHGYTIDGIHNTEEYDSRRTLCIPEGVKFIVIFENHIEQGFRELMSAMNKDYDQYILDIFTWCRSQEFPWPNYTDSELKRSYSNLCSFNNFKPNGKTGERIVRHFHRSVYKSHRNNKLSPWAAYQDDELLMRVIKNRFIYVNNLEPARILEGFNISKIAQKVSVFRPSLAKILINKYLSEFETIFDPFSGFSGRMLGCCSSGKQYIGQDLSGEAVTESNEIIKFLGLDASVVQKDVLGSSGEYPCLFTCSPYTDKEIWGTETEFKTCDEWIDICLQQFKCKKYLFVVDQTTKYKEFVVETIQNKSHFGKNFEQVICITK